MTPTLAEIFANPENVAAWVYNGRTSYYVTREEYEASLGAERSEAPSSLAPEQETL